MKDIIHSHSTETRLSEAANSPLALVLPKRIRGTHRRSKCLSVRLNNAEFDTLCAQAEQCGMKAPELLRNIALYYSPVAVPEVNNDRWRSLGRALGNLNQLAKTVNQGIYPGDILAVINEVYSEVIDLRHALKGEVLE